MLEQLIDHFHSFLPPPPQDDPESDRRARWMHAYMLLLLILTLSVLIIEAISYAIDVAKKIDSVLIAGKGHEKFQEIAGNKIQFDDVDVVENEFARRANG